MRISVVFVDEHTFFRFLHSNTHFLTFGITCDIGAHYCLHSGASRRFVRILVCGVGACAKMFEIRRDENA